MAQRRVTLETTLYGKRLVSVGQLYELHSEVTRAATLARQKDPKFLENQRLGRMAAEWRTARARQSA